MCGKGYRYAVSGGRRTCSEPTKLSQLGNERDLYCRVLRCRDRSKPVPRAAGSGPYRSTQFSQVFAVGPLDPCRQFRAGRCLRFATIPRTAHDASQSLITPDTATLPARGIN